jgi:hypothetical protein
LREHNPKRQQRLTRIEAKVTMIREADTISSSKILGIRASACPPPSGQQYRLRSRRA